MPDSSASAVNAIRAMNHSRAHTGLRMTNGAETATYSDPLEQALVLTAIVITFGITAFLLALAHRSWSESGQDEVEDDIEDRRIAGKGES